MSLSIRQWCRNNHDVDTTHCSAGAVPSPSAASDLTTGEAVRLRLAAECSACGDAGACGSVDDMLVSALMRAFTRNAVLEVSDGTR